ncbi:8364_t:CDS:2 [Paraglomus brasilianum]|uniref:8364_t:CDS:1 n=1 Tax=Paraglomus brasilianum TaxID=144538 RepID=A0A9N9C9Y0_9GLOM|nr:8364_t:CDS:2 [Paraglomus brasilianum]
MPPRSFKSREESNIARLSFEDFRKPSMWAFINNTDKSSQTVLAARRAAVAISLQIVTEHLSQAAELEETEKLEERFAHIVVARNSTALQNATLTLEASREEISRLVSACMEKDKRLRNDRAEELRLGNHQAAELGLLALSKE